MGNGYIVVTYRKIKDQEKWAAYAKLAVPAVQKAGGKFIVRANPSQVHELGMKERVVIVEFDNVHKAIAAHATPGYQEALSVLGDGAERDFRIVEGVS
jgi:uncharacterized protein (DUF1330 family)